MKRGKDKPTLVGDVNPSPLGDGAHALSERDAYIFVHFTQNEINRLRNMAVEIDESYQERSDA